MPTGDVDALRRRRRRPSIDRVGRRRCSTAWPARAAALTGPDRPVRESLSGTLVPKLSLPAVRRPRRAGALAAQREPARARSRSPPACSRSSARARTRRGCSPARAARRAPTAASSCSPRASRRPGCRPRSTRSRCTASIPAERPDIYGKVGNSGVSIATLDDMKVLYGGFDLCDPTTSVSMTINGPAPTILAMFLNTAIDQQLERFATAEGREPDRRRGRRGPRDARCAPCAAPCRPTSSRRTRARTPASSRPSSRSA